MGRVVVALGGNALLKRGEDDDRRQPAPQRRASPPRRWRRSASSTRLVITHGNGPQVGLLALQELAYEGEDYPLDVLGAETEGMIGYMIEQELGNLLPFEKPFATLLTMVEVDPNDPAFKDPTKFIGQVYDGGRGAQARPRTRAGGQAGRQEMAPRRALAAAQADLRAAADQVAAGEGHRGHRRRRRRHPDHVRAGQGPASGRRRVRDRQGSVPRSCWPREIGADVFVMRDRCRRRLSSTGASPSQKAIRSATPDAMDRYSFPAGSMGPKVEAVQDFARSTGKRAVICALPDILAAIDGEKGTTVAVDAGEIVLV